MFMINKCSNKFSETKKRLNQNGTKAISKYSLYPYCLILSFIFLLICTKSSPLYPFNDWVDSNAFFTMGKGMMNGKILYRDLFEQKGPLLYLIHGLAYLISNTTFLGVFVFEVISFSFFLFYSHKLISLFLEVKYSVIALPLITVIVLNMKSFTHGDSAEEFCIPLMVISLYYLIKYFEKIYPNPLSDKCILINGIAAGCVLWIKFSMLGFWFGWIVSIFVCMVINKNFKRGIRNCFVFLIGMIIATLPWILYFGINNSIESWLKTYIYINVSSYSSNISLLERLWYTFMQVFINTVLNTIFGILFYFGLIIFIIYKKFIKSRLNRACLLFSVFFLAFGVYGGGRRYVYYFLIFSPFVVLGLIVMLDMIKMKLDSLISFKTSIIIAILSLIITFPLTLLFNHNTYMLKIDKQNLVQYKYASVINQTKDATLLNYGYMDFGFYTVANIIPNIRFFENQNIDYSRFPLIMDEQNRYIKDKEVDYVVIGVEPSEDSTNLNIPYLYDNYSLIMEDTQMGEDNKYKYLLFKIK